ncbi:MAG TPA: ABC transporter ATP-binding protein [Acetobacteraceae bacterium]|nr:ABC transporter ATP-binding protein [Acetobacteraceae bacterium]
MNVPLLEVAGLSVGFSARGEVLPVVRDLSFSLDRGETLVIVGESGSGKSVTCLALMGLLPRPAGRVLAGAMRFTCKDGQVRDVARLDQRDMQHIRGAEIAMIFQEPMTSLNPVYTIGEQIIEAVQFHEAVSARAARARAAEMLALLGIPDPKARLNTYPHELSGGMRQRAMIGMALACRPALLIADEPTTALDVTVQAQILDLLRRLQRELGMAMIFVTHNLGVAGEIADRVLVMYAGQCVESGPRRAVFASPRMPYTMGLLRAVPRLGLDRSAGPLATIPGSVPDLAHLPKGCAFHPRCAFFRPALCDMRSPALEVCGAGHEVRCLRWRELTDA